MIKLSFYFFGILLLFSLCKKKGKYNSKACNGNTRREVKICTDYQAAFIDTTVIPISVKNFGDIVVPSSVKSETLRQAVEFKTYSIKAKVDKSKKERDGDVHLRLIDDEGNYVICESANPNCDYAQQSLFLNKIKEVRAFIEANDLEGKTIYITGIAFIDIDHVYKRKQAKNNMELHPILKISF